MVELEPGEQYAARLNGTSRTSHPVRVTVLDRHDPRRVRVRMESGPNAGTEQVAASANLICPWEERTALLRDEDSAARLAESDREVWDQTQADAAELVLEACTDGSLNVGYPWRSDVGRALWKRAGQDGSPLDHSPVNYADRRGEWHLDFATALFATHQLAVREPALMAAYLAKEELELRRHGWGPEELRRMAPAVSVVRSWTAEGLRGAQSPEVRRLQGLVRRAAELLRVAGDAAGADALQNALDGR